MKDGKRTISVSIFRKNKTNYESLFQELSTNFENRHSFPICAVMCILFIYFFI